MANFFKDVFKNYFSQQPQEDRRSMVASLLRQSMPADSQDDQLAALLKGAGPFMHKTLQLFCDKVQVQSTKTALSSVKTGLTPIERDLKTAMLERIVLDSKGNIEALRDVRSLGAASVGEALLADVQERPGADGKAVTRRVVIKLLRPGIVERAQRERAFFAETASRHKGVGSTFAGIAEQIEAEMDLKSEAKNVQAGQVYNGQATQLQAMKLSNLVPAQPNYMVVEQAPGSALQHYIDLSEKVARDDEVRGAQAELVGRKAAAQVAQLGRVWMAQALAGDGIFHGDLHAGNLMFNGDTGQLTVIDFGNAAVIDPKQRETLIRLAMTLQRGHPRLFEKEFRHLLGPSSESLAWAFKNSAIAQIKYIMRDGALDLADKLARILDEYTSAGLEVPAVITNFSRSMLMLQETLGRLNEVNRENFLRQHELGSELLKDRDECVARSRAPLDQDERELLQTQVNSINARLKIIKSPKPESMSDAFTQAVRPHAVKLVWRAGLGFAARVLKTSIEASTGFELEIARAKDKIVEMDDRIKQADVDEKVALKAKRQLLQKELDALLGLATPEVPAVPAASEAAA